jgi:nucleoside-triphosphatase THEP1
MKKIALIGSHGVGKTTICYDLMKNLKMGGLNADYLGEIAREAQKAGFRLNEDTTQDSQRWILHTQIARELEFKTREDVDILVCN